LRQACKGPTITRQRYYTRFLTGLQSQQKKRVGSTILHKFYRLKSEIAKLQGCAGQEKTVPSYCVMIRKVVITPSKTVILPPTIETSDRIIRHYKDHREHFLRVQFTDENEKLSLANGANHLSLFYRVYRTLETELRLDIGITNSWPSLQELRDSLAGALPPQKN